MPPRSNSRSFGSKCSALKKVLATMLTLLGAPLVGEYNFIRSEVFGPTAQVGLPSQCTKLAVGTTEKRFVSPSLSFSSSTFCLWRYFNSSNTYRIIKCVLCTRLCINCKQGCGVGTQILGSSPKHLNFWAPAPTS